MDTPECDWQDDRPALGIDVGIKSQVTLSDGAQYPKRQRSLTRMKRLQRWVSRAVKVSSGRRKKRLAPAKEHQRVQERERGYLHELTRRLVFEKSSRFYVEDLRVPNVVRNPNLARPSLSSNGVCLRIYSYTRLRVPVGGCTRWTLVTRRKYVRVAAPCRKSG